MGHGSNPNFVGGTFRARNDDGPSEVAPPTGASWFAGRGADWGQLVDTNFRIRMLVYSITSINDNLHTLHLGASYNGGAYFVVDPTTTVIKLSPTTHFANNDPTSDWAGRLGVRKLYPDPMGSLVDGDDAGHTFDIQSASHNLNELEFEAEFSLQVVSADVSDGDTIDLKIFHNPLSPFIRGYTVPTRMTVSSVPVITNTPAIGGSVGLDSAEAMTATGGPLTWSLTDAPDNATIDPATGLISWIPTELQKGGRFDFTAVATTLVGSDTLTWEVLVADAQMTAKRVADPVLTARTEAVPVLKAKTEATLA